MKTLIVFLSFFYTFQNPSENIIIGTWNTLENNTKIHIVEEKGMLIGRIKSSDNTQVQVGKIILKDLIKTGKSWSGKIFSLKRNEWYDVEIFPQKNKLDLKIQIGFIQKSITWEKT